MPRSTPPTPTTPPRGGLPARIALTFLRGILTALILIDEIARPVYRPLTRWLSSLRLVARAEAAVAGLPRLAILILLAVPFAVAEPMKILGVVWLGQGRVAAGLLVLAVAYFASFLIVERIHHAGRDKLMSYRWFAWGMGWIVLVRERLLAWVKASRAYAAAKTLAGDIRSRWREVVARRP